MSLVARVKQKVTGKAILLTLGVVLILLVGLGQLMTGQNLLTKFIKIPGAFDRKDWTLESIQSVEDERFVLLERIHNGPDMLRSFRFVESDLFGRSTSTIKELLSVPYITDFSPNLRYYTQSTQEPDNYEAIYDFATDQKLNFIQTTSKTNIPVPTCHWSPSIRYLGCRTISITSDPMLITFFDTVTMKYTAPFRVDTTGSPYMYDFTWVDDDTILMTGSKHSVHELGTGRDEVGDESNVQYLVSNLFDTPAIQRMDNLATCIETVYMNSHLYCLRPYSDVKVDKPWDIAQWGVRTNVLSHIMIQQELSQESALSYKVLHPFPIFSGDTMQMNDTYIAVYSGDTFSIVDTVSGKRMVFNDYQYLYSEENNLTSKDTTIFGPQNFYQYSAIYRKVEEK